MTILDEEPLMSRCPFAALAVAFALCAAGSLLGSPSVAEAQCLDRTACKEIKAEIAKLEPDLTTTRQQIKKSRRALRTIDPGSDRSITKRVQLKRFKKTFKAVRRELKALQLDFRHQACSSC